MNRFTNYFGAEALMKIDSKVKTIQNKLIDITDMLELLELTSKNISDKLCPAELHLVRA